MFFPIDSFLSNTRVRVVSKHKSFSKSVINSGIRQNFILVNLLFFTLNVSMIMFYVDVFSDDVLY